MKISEVILLFVICCWLYAACVIVSAQSKLKPELLVQKGHKNNPNFVTFSKNGELMASTDDGDKSPAILLWHIKTGKSFAHSSKGK